MFLFLIFITLLIVCIVLVIVKFLIYSDNELYENIKKVKFTGDFKIPRIIHQTYSSWDQLTPGVKKVINENIKMNTNWKYNFYDNKTIYKYIKEHESEYVYSAFKKINPLYGAALADLFRYIVIYHEGGVYMDIKSKTNIPLDDWVHKDKLQLSLFGPENILLKKYYNNNKLKNIIPRELQQIILIYPKKHPILRLLIDKICSKIYKYNNNVLHFFPKRIKNGYKILSLTGPWMYTKILMPYVINNYENCIIYNKNNYNGLYNGYILYDGTNGEYHNNEHSKKRRYLDLKEKIIL